MWSSENYSEYFHEVLILLKKFKWLHDVPLTNILIDQSLDKIPNTWLSILGRLHYEQLNNFVTKLNMQLNWPTSLTAFLNKCKKLNKLTHLKIPSLPTKLPMIFTKNINLKKQHEILYFSQLIHYNCLLQNISMIVDLGTGLGYVCQLLNYLYGYEILGLDSSHLNIDRAKLRQKNIFPNTLPTIKYICLNITEDSDKFLESILKKEFQEKRKICLIGLHACGDLSIHASNIYLKMKIARLLVLVPCCYHKLSYKEMNINNTYNKKEYFKYFPLSDELKNTICFLCIDIGSLLKRTFMRLASQETSDRWLIIDREYHDKHSLHVLSRAVLELYAYDNGLKIKKKINKGTRKSQYFNFKDYLKESRARYDYEKINDGGPSVIKFSWTHEIEKNILSLWNRNNGKLKIIEPYTALQMILQNIAESLVLIDRLHFFQEQNCNPALFSVPNRSLSPRSFVLISNKINWK